MPKRIHELAKEWNVPPKDLIGGLEKLGIRGKRSQSSLSDEEVQRVHEALGLAPLVMTLGCGGRQALPPSTEPPEVTVSKPVARDDVTDFVDFTGRLDAVQSVDIKARATGNQTRIAEVALS